MPQYQFTSPGAAVSGALQQFMLQRKAEERQAMLDELNKQNIQSEMADREQNRANQAENIASQKAAREAAAAATALARQGTLAEHTPIGADVSSPDMQTALGPYAGNVTEIGGAMDPAQGEGPTVKKGWAGTAKQQETAASLEEKHAQAQAAIEAKAELARHEQESKKEIADARNENARLIASMNATNKHEAATEKAAEKQQKADEDKANKRKTAKSLAEQALQTLDQMVMPTDPYNANSPKSLTPRMKTYVGSYNIGGRFWPGSEPANAYALHNQLQSQLMVDLIGEMKAQSRTGATGFGALSEREGDILRNAAGRLDPNQSPEDYAKALEEIRSRLMMVLQDEPTTPHISNPGATDAIRAGSFGGGVFDREAARKKYGY